MCSVVEYILKGKKGQTSIKFCSEKAFLRWCKKNNIENVEFVRMLNDNK